MEVNLNLTQPTSSSISLDEVIFSQATTELTFSVTPSDKTLEDGLSCALLTAQGKTLAHALTNANKAILDTSTIECYEYVQGLPIEGAKDAYIVIGESTEPLAIVSVQVAKNYLADIAPPSATAPIYPTSQELQSILTTLQEAIDRVGEIENIVEGFDEEVTKGIGQINTATTDGIGSINALVSGFDTTVQDGISQVNQATTEGTQAINALTSNFDTQATEAITQINTTTQQATESIESETEDSLEAITNVTNSGTTSIANATTEATTTISNATTQATTAIDNKVDAFNEQLAQDKQEIANAVTEAEGARDEAETARDETLEARDEAVVALNNGCVYEVRDVTDANLALDKTLTAYKHTPTSDTTYTFATPTDASGKIVVFWLWIVMSDTAHAITFPSNVTWINEPSLGANSQCMLALMSVDNGTSWIANIQWEK